MIRLKMIRAAAGKTQAEVAAALGMSRVAYTNIENGKRDPGLEVWGKIADFFGVSLDYLLGREKMSNGQMKRLVMLMKKLENVSDEEFEEYMQLLDFMQKRQQRKERNE
ncbi:MAG: helix-turn-helix transcriptional regulator [Clostridiales bacterium]|nr:helix-turn-helix transcriptional regulator [Clostridiales bacterium]